MRSMLVMLALALSLAASGCTSSEERLGSSTPDRRHRSYFEPPLIHGTAVISTLALPDRQKLSRGTYNTVIATTDLAFAVVIEDTGDLPEANVSVTLTIEQSPSPIVQTMTIARIGPGEL